MLHDEANDQTVCWTAVSWSVKACVEHAVEIFDQIHRDEPNTGYQAKNLQHKHHEKIQFEEKLPLAVWCGTHAEYHQELAIQRKNFHFDYFWVQKEIVFVRAEMISRK